MQGFWHPALAAASSLQAGASASAGRSPAIFPKRLFSALEGLSGDAGGGALLKARPDEAAATIPVEAAAEEELFDIDTAEDLGCAEEMLREEQEGER